jgi:leader peptidase (prepilin peptidase)/N-methyltransferase
VAVAICITVFVIDFEHELILDKVVFPGIVVMAVLFIALDILAGGFINIRMGLLGAAAGFIPFWLLWYASKWFTGKTGKWMGFGDVKFAAFMGLALGLKNLVVALFLSFTVGAVVGIVLMATGKKHFSSRIPFGTFLALATILSLFWGNQLWAWYWKLLTLN